MEFMTELGSGPTFVPRATVLVAIVLTTSVLAGCIGTMSGSGNATDVREDDGDPSTTDRRDDLDADPTREADDPSPPPWLAGDRDCPPRWNWKPVSDDRPDVAIDDRGDETTYTFSDTDLTYHDTVFPYAIQVAEPVHARYDIQETITKGVDDVPPRGWMHITGATLDAPVCLLSNPDWPTSYRTNHDDSDYGIYATSDSSAEVRVVADGRTWIDRHPGHPYPPDEYHDTSTGQANLSEDRWILVHLGGASGQLGDDTRIQVQVTVNGTATAYGLPAYNLTWGWGWEEMDNSTVAASAGEGGVVHDARYTSSMDGGRTLSVATSSRLDTKPYNDGRIVFPGDNRSIPHQGWPILTAPSSGRIGFDIDRWQGDPLWFLLDGWLPGLDWDI